MVLDIGTEAVKVLVCRRENSSIVVLGAATQYFEKYGVFDGKEFEIEIVKKAIIEIVKEDWRGLPVLVSLPPDLLRAGVVRQFLSREKPKKKITQKEEELISQQVFKEKYPERVSVYSIGDFSKEICAGPHVKRTSELGKFRIIKEESFGAGIRRLRAILE